MHRVDEFLFCVLTSSKPIPAIAASPVSAGGNACSTATDSWVSTNTSVSHAPATPGNAPVSWASASAQPTICNADSTKVSAVLHSWNVLSVIYELQWTFQGKPTYGIL